MLLDQAILLGRPLQKEELHFKCAVSIVMHCQAGAWVEQHCNQGLHKSNQTSKQQLERNTWLTGPQILSTTPHNEDAKFAEMHYLCLGCVLHKAPARLLKLLSQAPAQPLQHLDHQNWWRLLPAAKWVCWTCRTCKSCALPQWALYWQMGSSHNRPVWDNWFV